MTARGQSLGTVATAALVLQAAARRPRDTESPCHPRLLSVEAAAAYLGVSPWLVRQYVQAGELPVTRLPRPRTASAIRAGARRPVSDVLRVTLIDREALDEWIDRRCTRERLSAGVFPYQESHG